MRLLARIFVVAVGLQCVSISVVHAQVPANVTTGHDDNARTGLNAQETTLTPANVNSTSFGKLFSVPVDGYVYAQPLYLSNVSIANVTHNVVYVVTEHDSAYAIDADNGGILWQVSFINPSAGVTTVPSGDVACGDLTPEIGITSTPAIDTASGTIYLLARTKENGSYVQRLHALDVTTGVEQPGSPVTISASVNGNGDGSSGGTISFDPFLQQNRPGLLLQNGHVLIGWASLCDRSPYHGWVMSYNASSLAQEAVFNTTPNGGLGGIWMSGAGLAGDSSFSTYFATGNGTYNGSTDFGDSVVKLAPPNGNSFPLSDWFTPFDQGSLDSGDIDLGSGGVLLLPDQPLGSPHQHLLLQAGKEGTLYLIDRDNMGHFNPNNDSQIVQSLRGALPGLWGLPAWWNNNVYVAGSGDFGGSTDHLKAFAFDTASGMLSASPTSQSLISFAFPGPTPSVSANGTANGIVWVLQNDQSQSSDQSVLRAFDATDLSKELYNSQQNAARDNPGAAVKFTLPTVVNGKVYLGTQTQLSAFGILTTGPVAPAITSASNTTFTVGAAGEFTVTATGSPTPTLSKTGALPSGVTFTDNGNGTGTLAGTPAAGTVGSYPITITAHNGVGTDATQSFTLTVNSAPVAGPIAFVRQAGNFGESVPYTVNISPTAGDFLVVFVWQAEGGLTPSTSDNLGSTYTQDCDLAYDQGSGFRRLTVYHLLNAPSGITGVHITPNQPSRGIVAEYSGMPRSGSVLDVCGIVRNQNNPVTNWGSNATTTTSTDLVFGLADTKLSGGAGYKASGAWTGRLEQSDPRNVDDSYFEDQIMVSAGSYTATGTTVSSVTESSVVVTFKTSTGP